MPDGFFSFRELDRRRVAIILERSLQDLVDRRAPITAIQFRLACRGPAGVFSYLPITVSIEDVNDNVPEFVNAPYGPIVVDELAPPGKIFNQIILSNSYSLDIDTTKVTLKALQ